MGEHCTVYSAYDLNSSHTCSHLLAEAAMLGDQLLTRSHTLMGKLLEAAGWSVSFWRTLISCPMRFWDKRHIERETTARPFLHDLYGYTYMYDTHKRTCLYFRFDEWVDCLWPGSTWWPCLQAVRKCLLYKMLAALWQSITTHRKRSNHENGHSSWHVLTWTLGHVFIVCYSRQLRNGVGDVLQNGAQRRKEF